MRTPSRAILRLAFAGWLGLVGLSHLPARARAQASTPPENVLPDSAFVFLKVNNAQALRQAFGQSQFGQLWADPAMKAWKDDLVAKIDDTGKPLKEKIGVTIRELLELPQGAISFAVVARDDPKNPAAVLISADAGKNAGTMTKVLTRATEQGEQKGAKVSTETFQGSTLHVIQFPDSKPGGADKAKNVRPIPPLIWTSQGSVFSLASNVEALKDVLSHSKGRDNSLAKNESYLQARKKLGADAQVVWFVDIARVLKLAAQAPGAQAGGGQGPQIEGIIEATGLKTLKAAAGSFTLNSGSYDSLSKLIILSPGPAQGVLKVFTMPRVNLRPESWVPASVASYQTASWDLDAAYTAINDLVNMFQPGVLNVLEQQLVGPNGGEPLSFQNDLFGPIGDRMTFISDYKKPITEDSQRLLVGIALEDAKAFQTSLNKIIALTNGAPKKREFQGTTIYDFAIPNMPNAGAANVNKIKGPISLAIAKNTLFVSSEPTFLEQVLRGGGSTLADSSMFQAVAKEIPDSTSSLSYTRPEEQARLSYDMIKNGQFEKALRSAAMAGGPDMSAFGKLIDKDKLPDFSVFAKYLSQGGGYAVMEEDGLTWTGFTLRKANP